MTGASTESTRLFSTLLGVLPDPVLRLFRSPNTARAIEVLSVLVTFVILDRFVASRTHLSHEGYNAVSLLGSFLREVHVMELLVIAAGALLLGWYGVLMDSWSRLERGTLLRWSITILAASMTWFFTTLGYNFYFDQAYTLDRIVLALLTVLVWWRPVFIYPFLVAAYVLLWQIVEPTLGGSVLAHKLQVLRVLTLFGAAFLVQSLTGSRRSDSFVFLFACFVAAAYWEPALAKMQLGWADFGHLYHMPLAAYAHGWLWWLSPTEVVEFATAISRLDEVALIFVLVLEGLALLFMWRRGVSVVLLLGFMVFHVAVFALYGFLFWTWILLDLVLLALLLGSVEQIYRLGYFLGSVLLIAGAGFWARPPQLAWFDVPLTYTYRVQAVTEEGSRTVLPASLFSPYEDVFKMAPFRYLANDKRLAVNTYGVSIDRTVADALLAVKSADEVFALERSLGVGSDHDPKAGRFEAFVGQFLANRNCRPDQLSLLSALKPPRQFWTGGDTTSPPKRIELAVVQERTTFYDGRNLRVIRERDVLRMPVHSAACERADG